MDKREGNRIAIVVFVNCQPNMFSYSSILLFVTFDTMLGYGRHICFTRSSPGGSGGGAGKGRRACNYVSKI